MAWYKCGGGSSAEDGNDIAYPVVSPSNEDKLYKESDVNAIALAIGENNLKIADMADAINDKRGGLLVCSGSMDYINTPIEIVEYTVVS